MNIERLQNKSSTREFIVLVGTSTKLLLALIFVTRLAIFVAPARIFVLEGLTLGFVLSTHTTLLKAAHQKDSPHDGEKYHYPHDHAPCKHIAS